MSHIKTSCQRSSRSGGVGRRGLSRVLLGCLAILSGPAVARAQTYTVDGTAFSGTIPFVSSGTTYPIVNLINGATIDGNVFLNSGTSSGTLRFSGDNVTVSNVISGSGAVWVSTTSGTVTFTGLNDYSGGLNYGTLIDYGTLRVASGGAISHSAADLFIGETSGQTGTLLVDGGSVTAADMILGHLGGATGTLAITSGTLATTGSLIVGGEASSTGSASISGGTVTLGSSLVAGLGGTATVSITGGDVTAALISIGVDTGSDGTLTVGGGGTLTSAGDIGLGLNGGTAALEVQSGGLVAFGGTLSGTGTVTVDAGGILQSGTGGSGGAVTMSITNDGQVVFDSSGDHLYTDHSITGTGSVVKRGSGTLTINSANDYGGGTSVESGALVITGNGSLSHPTAGMAVSSGANLLVSGALTSGSSSVSGTATVDGGNWTTSDLTVSGSLGVVNGGIVIATGTVATAGSGAIDVDTGDLWIGNQGATGHLEGDVHLGEFGQITFIRSGTDTYSGDMWGTGMVNVYGGTGGTLSLTMNGTNTYTGATTVGDTAGTLTANLFVNGELGQTAVQVNSGSLLGGTGTIGGTVTVADSGILSPGSLATQAVGALTVGSLTLTAYTDPSLPGSTTQMTVNSLSSYDQIVGVDPSASSLSYGGNLQLDFNGTGYADLSVFHLFSNFAPGSMAGNFDGITLSGSSDFTGLTFSFDNANGLWLSGTSSGGQYLEFNASTGNLVVVPEPSTLLLAASAFGAAGLLWGRRRRDAAEDSPRLEALSDRT